MDWPYWDRLIAEKGITIERPFGSAHPAWEEILYPLDYGFINDTVGEDGAEVDIFVGSAANGLVGAILTMDHRRQDREVKLIYNCSPVEIYVVNGFINFDRQLMEGALVLRRPMRELW